MDIQIIRDRFTAQSTFANCYIDSKLFGETLEDTVRPHGIKVMHNTAIPEGCYKVALRYSPRFKRMLPIIYTEDDGITLKAGGISFTYVLIHAGNKHQDTSGCILIAEKENIESISNSRKWEEKLVARIETAILNGESIRLEVINLEQAA